MLEVTRRHFGLSVQQMHAHIQIMRDQVENLLSTRGVEYSQLRTALMPSRTNGDAALIFDTSKIADDLYGRDLFGTSC